MVTAESSDLQLTLRIDVYDVNEAMTLITLSKNSVLESQDLLVEILQIVSNDPDLGQTITYSKLNEVRTTRSIITCFSIVNTVGAINLN